VNEIYLWTGLRTWRGSQRGRRRIADEIERRDAEVDYERQDMATLFVTELGDVTDFPEDFAGMLRYLADYEAVDYKYSPEGSQVCDALFDQFCAKWFPGPLRPLGRTMILALLDEPAHRVHRLPHVRPATRRAVELGLRLTFLLKEKVLPDPKLSTPERNRRKLSRKPGFRAPQHETVDTGLSVT
jgi:hypothetical protein